MDVTIYGHRKIAAKVLLEDPTYPEKIQLFQPTPITEIEQELP